MDIKYFSMDQLPGKYFNCEKLSGTMTDLSCAAQFRKHKGGSSKCSECEIGAFHSGERIVHGLPERFCPRCGGTDKRLIYGNTCISCYNRGRELLAGKNAKGAFPKYARTFRRAIVFVPGMGTLTMERVVDVAEAVLTVLRGNPTARVRPVLDSPPVRQMSLFPEWL